MDKQKFPFFIKTIQSFSKEFKNQQKMRDEMTREVDGFLDENNFSGISIFMKKGYHPNKEQILRIINNFPLYQENAIKSTIYKTYDTSVKDEILEDMLKIDSKLKGFGTLTKKSDAIKKLSKSYEAYHQVFTHEELFADGHYALKFLKIAKQTEVSLTSVISESYKGSRDKEKPDSYYFARHDLELLREKIRDTNAHIIHSNQASIEKALHERASKYDAVLETFDTLKEHMVNSVRNFRESDLPVESHVIYKELKDKYSLIDLDTVSAEQKMQLELFYKKRLPQVLEEYMTISPEYREKFKSQAVNPDTLLLDSLTEIKQKVSEVYAEIEDNKLNKMKATNRYLKAV